MDEMELGPGRDRRSTTTYPPWRLMATDFVDTDCYSNPRSASASTPRAPSREDLDAQLTGTQQQLAKLREAQDQLERTVRRSRKCAGGTPSSRRVGWKRCSP